MARKILNRVAVLPNPLLLIAVAELLATVGQAVVVALVTSAIRVLTPRVVIGALTSGVAAKTAYTMVSGTGRRVLITVKMAWTRWRDARAITKYQAQIADAALAANMTPRQYVAATLMGRGVIGQSANLLAKGATMQWLLDSSWQMMVANSAARLGEPLVDLFNTALAEGVNWNAVNRVANGLAETAEVTTDPMTILLLDRLAKGKQGASGLRSATEQFQNMIPAGSNVLTPPASSALNRDGEASVALKELQRAQAAADRQASDSLLRSMILVFEDPDLEALAKSITPQDALRIRRDLIAFDPEYQNLATRLEEIHIATNPNYRAMTNEQKAFYISYNLVGWYISSDAIDAALEDAGPDVKISPAIRFPEAFNTRLEAYLDRSRRSGRKMTRR